MIVEHVLLRGLEPSNNVSQNTPTRTFNQGAYDLMGNILC